MAGNEGFPKASLCVYLQSSPPLWELCYQLGLADPSRQPFHWQLWVGLVAAVSGTGGEGSFHTTD